METKNESGHIRVEYIKVPEYNLRPRQSLEEKINNLKKKFPEVRDSITKDEPKIVDDGMGGKRCIGRQAFYLPGWQSVEIKDAKYINTGKYKVAAFLVHDTLTCHANYSSSSATQVYFAYKSRGGEMELIRSWETEFMEKTWQEVRARHWSERGYPAPEFITKRKCGPIASYTDLGEIRQRGEKEFVVDLLHWDDGRVGYRAKLSVDADEKERARLYRVKSKKKYGLQIKE